MTQESQDGMGTSREHRCRYMKSLSKSQESSSKNRATKWKQNLQPGLFGANAWLAIQTKVSIASKPPVPYAHEKAQVVLLEVGARRDKKPGCNLCQIPNLLNDKGAMMCQAERQAMKYSCPVWQEPGFLCWALVCEYELACSVRTNSQTLGSSCIVWGGARDSHSVGPRKESELPWQALAQIPMTSSLSLYVWRNLGVN